MFFRLLVLSFLTASCLFGTTSPDREKFLIGKTEAITNTDEEIKSAKPESITDHLYFISHGKTPVQLDGISLTLADSNLDLKDPVTLTPDLEYALSLGIDGKKIKKVYFNVIGSTDSIEVFGAQLDPQ